MARVYVFIRPWHVRIPSPGTSIIRWGVNEQIDEDTARRLNVDILGLIEMGVLEQYHG